VVCLSGGAVSAVVLPTIPAPLFNEYDKVRTLDFLVMARAKPPSAKGRVVLLLRMAEILAFVHSRGLVHGDINGKNLAWTLDNQPVMYLIDCDGMVPQVPAPTAGVGAPGWMDPRLLGGVIPAHDHYSDWYALALAMYRGLLLTPGRLDTRKADGSWPSPGHIPAELAAPVADLVRRGLSDPLRPQHRPTPREWAEALLAAYIPNGQYDEDAFARLDKVTTPRPAPKPKTFQPVPPADWRTPRQPPPSSRRPRPAQPSPYQPAPQPAPPVPVGAPPASPAPVPGPYSPAPQQWSGPVPYQYQSPHRPHTKAVGGVGWRAMHPTVGWHVLGVLASFLVAPGALVYTTIGLIQLRNASGMPGATKARVALGVYLGIAAFFTIAALVSMASSSSSPTYP
jgi:hypothetical protein